ncbi:MAG: lycopene cyclase family protein, partial [Novosphingobium sp.]|nr:lycopene cyclase family protein [Novosphingobium sp.]
AIAAQVHRLAAERGICGAELRQESGVLPILISGDPEAFWPQHDRIARLGLRGGFFHPTTGYSFGLALRLADELAKRNGAFDSAALVAWARQRFLRHWRDTRFFRLLNRMLFYAALPHERYRVFQHFYRLPPDLIARFYAGALRGADRMRILSGRPPVPLPAAILALLGVRRRSGM